MRVTDWLRPPRHLLLLFAAVTLVPAAALVWLGWQFFELDRVFEEQQVSRRLAASADGVSSGIARHLDSAVRDLPGWLEHPPEGVETDATLVRLGANGVLVNVGAPLLFVPAVPKKPAFDRSFDESIGARWLEAEHLEYRERNFEKAAGAFTALAASSDTNARAMALVAAARNLRALGRREAALEAYRTLARLTAATVIDEPADLVARAAECAVLRDLGRGDELTRAATTLADDLARGRWRIDRATFEMRADQVRAWAPLVLDDDSLARASALEAFWAEHRGRPDAPASGHKAAADDRGSVVIWRTVGDEVFALVAGRGYFARLLSSRLASRTVRVSFENPGGQTAKLRAADLGLPWDLYIGDAAAIVDSTNFAARRRLLGWSLAALVILVPASGYVVWRAVQKELAVARLQADFVSAVSHEFRTPLTSMAHLTDRLQRDAAVIPEDRKRQYYDVLARDTDRLKRFVETLLDFGRTEAGAAPVRASDDDLTAVVSAVVAEFRGDAAAAEREIRMEAGGPLPPVRVDREAFGRALWNLLDNAAKYSPVGSPITVAIRREPSAACVDVSDIGAGIPAAERRQIFKKFVRGEGSKAAGIRGTGVGLALVDHIIRAHGGEVRLDSAVGRGSTFSLVLPIEGSGTP